MKTPKINRLAGTLGPATLSAFLFLASQAQPVFANSDARGAMETPSAAANRGYLSTPRAREEFPSLTRNVITLRRVAKARALASGALANSPRFREEHPELLRQGELLVSEASATVPAEIAKNRVVVASPRAREEFPALQRTPPPGAREKKRNRAD